MCPICHSTKKSPRSRTDCCSRKCWQEWIKVTTVTLSCAYCGKDVVRAHFDIKPDVNVFCDCVCNTKYMNEHGISPKKQKAPWADMDAFAGRWTYLARRQFVRGHRGELALPRGAAARAATRMHELGHKAPPTAEIAQYLYSVLVAQGFRCPMTGVMLERHGLSHLKTSMDRIDCSQGYVEGNVRFISLTANLARGDRSDSEFYAFCHAVHTGVEPVPYFTPVVVGRHKNNECGRFKQIIKQDTPTRNRWKVYHSWEDVKSVWESQGGRCPVTGISLVLPFGNYGWNYKQEVQPPRWVRASIDRIDCSKHYTPDNIQIVSQVANLARYTDPDYTSVKAMAAAACAFRLANAACSGSYASVTAA